MARRERERCPWARPANPRYVAYHDEEWGVPCRDEARLFELVNLEGAQAGLSWETILNKREGYRAAFHGWDPARIARYGARDVARLLADARIVRHRGKIAAAIANARATLRLYDAGSGLAPLLWGFVDGRPVQGAFTSLAQVPARTALSERVARELSRRGFRFVGPTTVYAYLQAVGVVNDHLVGCFRHAPVARLGRARALSAGQR